MEAVPDLAGVVVAASENRTRARLAELASSAFTHVPLTEARDAAGLAEAAATFADIPGQLVVLIGPALGGVDTRDAVGLALTVHPNAAVVVAGPAENHALVKVALDSGALSCIDLAGSRSTALAVLAAAANGNGLVDRAIACSLIDSHAGRLDEERRRDRGVIASLAAAVEAKDSVTSRHQRSVSRLAVAIGRLVEPELAATQDFLFGALLHDVGKIGVPERILGKAGPLDAREWEIMRRHPATGARLIGPLRLSRVVNDMVLRHHERWDGAGYPDGLEGNEIPIAARIFSVADSLEAMTADRPYRSALPVTIALERIFMERAQQFDPRIVDALHSGISQGRIDLDSVLDPASAFPPAPRVAPGPLW